MGKVKEEEEVAVDAQKAADQKKRREIYAQIKQLENPTNREIFGLLSQLPPIELTLDPVDIIRELRGPLPGDPDAEPLPPK